MKAINHLGSLNNRQFLFVSGKEILEIATTLIMGIFGSEVLLCISSLPVIFFYYGLGNFENYVSRGNTPELDVYPSIFKCLKENKTPKTIVLCP